MLSIGNKWEDRFETRLEIKNMILTLTTVFGSRVFLDYTAEPIETFYGSTKN